MSETGVWSTVLHACFAFFAIAFFAVVVGGAVGCSSTGCDCCGICASCGNGRHYELMPAHPPAPPLEIPPPSPAAVDESCDTAAANAVTDAQHEALKAADAGDLTGAIVVVDNALGTLRCEALRPTLLATRQRVFEHAEQASTAEALKNGGDLCEIYPRGWRARVDARAVLANVVGRDAMAGDALRQAVNARIEAHWPGVGEGNQALASALERGLRAQFAEVPASSSSWTIEHTVERCSDSDRPDELLGRMHSYSCVGRAVIKDEHGSVWQTAPVQAQVLGINVDKAVEQVARGSGGRGMHATLANEIALHVLDDAERRMCNR